ncbi:hypothetical protein BDR26DRAFT_1003961 [Obelidium mucronatum]|nr:hypothetical protein BDR26DRAFT_1003961 [Obelidium mucronatum]
MPSIPFTERTALAAPTEPDSVEHAIAMFSLFSMICACVYILYCAVRAALAPIKALAAKQRRRRSLDPHKHDRRIAALQRQMAAEFDECAAPGSDAFDAMLDQMIENEKCRLDSRDTRDSLDAGVPGIAEGLRRRTAKNVVASDAQIKHRQMMKSLREIYDFDENDGMDEDDDGEISDDVGMRSDNDVRV